ncbi:CTTNBP2 N-terminal-like protein [Trachymyrmex zeteki]|uniref:CTTNBP2 N-terminal-like protein n=1 Tax=Mycetomoellerius zeteki TaxID=64791 RepID=A0A151X2E5_9HYME|nr:CTTNBP2 N-terminal-like protein [Trachymyrmex zeteki]
MASQNQGAVNVSSPGITSAMTTTTTTTTTTANGPPSTSAPSPGTTVLTSAATISAAKALTSGTQPSQSQSQQQQANNIEPLDKSSSNTLKRNPKMELSKTDLLKLLGYLEGELQARDIVIAALKSEKMKHLLSSRYLSSTADPHAALARDVAIVGGVIGVEGNQIDQQVASLEALVTQQRKAQCRMTKVLRDAEIRHRAVIKELEEEKRKHEHDTAQGDDITYGLEKERTRLKKELELEKQEKKRLEMELKKINDHLEEEKSRQKQIVLLLLAERKKIIMKYIEERKRSEDLAQILSEEKVRIDSMAEGLEEESKKSLQMEAELEKQLAQFDMERQQYRQALVKEEKRAKDFETELEKLRGEMDTWKESQTRGPARGVCATPPPPPAKPANLVAMPTLRPASAPQTMKGAVLGTGTPMVSSKVVQPTATVSSVPVSGPTTGIARSVTPGQALRGVAYTPNLTSVGGDHTRQKRQPVVPAPVSTAAAAAAKLITSSQAAVAAAGKLGFHVGQSSSPAASPTVQASAAAAASGAGGGGGGGILPAKKPPISRGVPPPVPPNKPVVPPKKEAAAYLRRPEMQSQSAPQQDTVKYGKPAAPSHGAASTAASGTAPLQVQQQPLPASTIQPAADEEVSSKTAESR